LIGGGGREDIVETREAPLKEHDEWTVKYMKADERVKALLPRMADLSQREKLTPWVASEESIAERESAEKELDTIEAKLREIRQKLSQI
jgi:hypothetical protein